MKNETVLVALDEQFLNKFFGITDSKYCMETVDLLKLKQQLELIEDVLIDHKIKEFEQFEFLPSPQSQVKATEPIKKVKTFKKALIVNELGVFSHQISRIFKNLGAASVVVKTAEDALKAFQREDFDIVVMDLAIPSAFEGFTLLDELRRIINASAKDCQIGIISSYARQDDKKRALVKGAKFYVESKQNWQELLEKEIRK